MVNNGKPAGNELRRVDDLPAQLQALRDTVVAGGAILETAEPCGDGWHITHRQFERLAAAVQAVLAGEPPTD